MLNSFVGAEEPLLRRWPTFKAALIACCCLLITGLPQLAAAQSAGPNVLLIIVDDLNDWIGALGGHPQADTPRIDALAAQGVLFTNAHAPGPICHPSRASLMTAISPGRSGIKTNAEQPWRDYLPDAVSMNQAFRDAGYETVGYGKVYHGNEENHDLPNWDFRIPRPTSAEPPANEIPINGLDQIDRGGPGGGDWGIVDEPASEFEDHKVATWAVDYINARDINDPQPFFLAVGLRSTHSPWYFPPAYFDRIAGGVTDNVLPPATLDNDLNDVGPVARQWAAEDIWAPLINDAAKVREGVHSYLAGAAFADDQVGRMLDALDTSGLAENTIVVLVSDHGYHLSEKQMWQKQNLWEEDTKVPLIFRVPANLLSTQVPQVDLPASISAIFPTLLELAGISMPDYPQGDPLYRVDYRSLVPLLAGSDANWAGPAVTYGRGEDATIRTSEHRFTYYQDQFTELYDKLVDSEEWFNVADAAQYQDEIPLWTSDALRYLAGQHAPFGYRETCGPPLLDPAQDFGVHLWRDCDGPNPEIWKVRVTGGDVASEQTFAGEITSDSGFDTVSPVTLEANDILDNGIQFEFRVVGGDADGVDFSYPSGAQACLNIPSLPFGADVFVGATRFPVTLPFDPQTLAYCGPPPPTGEIGDFVWQDLDGDGIQDQSEPGFAGADVRLLDCNDNEIAATTTDANGTYWFQQLAVGSYRIRFIAPAGYEYSPRKVPAGNGGYDSNPDPATGLSNCLSLADGQSRIGIDAGLVDLGGVLPDLSISDASANEDSGTLTFNVSLTSAAAEAVTFTASTTDGSALISDNDYVALADVSGLIAAGETMTTVDVILTADSVVETNETLLVTVSNVSTNVSVADNTATGTILNDDSGGSGVTPLESWTTPTGGVSVSNNQITYTGSPTGWFQNTVNSQPLSSLGFSDNFEVRWTIDSDPTGTVWIVGLGTTETNSDWTDIEYGLRITGGLLDIRENGSWLAFGPALAQGDVISIYVNNGTIEYRHNGIAVLSSTYTGTPDFYVDTSFKQGAITFSVDILGDPVDPDPPSIIDITAWTGQTGGVSVTGNTLFYSGTPTGWQNTVNSAPLSSLGAGADFTVGWTVQTSPGDTIWIVGLGLTETDVDDWRDVDFGIRSSAGSLNVRENGTWVKGGGALAAGDRLEIRVIGTTLEYRHNGVVVATSTITGTEDFYIDTAFKSGAIELGSFTLTQ